MTRVANTVCCICNGSCVHEGVAHKYYLGHADPGSLRSDKIYPGSLVQLLGGVDGEGTIQRIQCDKNGFVTLSNDSVQAIVDAIMVRIGG